MTTDALADLFRHETEADPCEPANEVIDRGDHLIRARPSSARDPWSSSVREIRWSQADAERGIDSVIRFYRLRGLPFVVSVDDRTTPADLGARLEARGLVRETDGLLLAARLPIQGLRTDPALTIREALDEGAVRDWIAVQHPGWAEERRGRLLPELVAYVRCPEHARRAAVAYLDGRPIAAARWRLRGPAVHLSGAETLPEFRGRGAYSTLVAYRAREGARAGARYATIVADVTTSAPILLKRGFVVAGRNSFYLCADPARASLSA